MSCQTKPSNFTLIGCFLLISPILVWSVYATVLEQNTARDACTKEGKTMQWVTFYEGDRPVGKRWECRK